VTTSSSGPLVLGSFRRQIVVLTGCVTAFAMVVLTVVLQLILADLSKSNVDRVLEDRADAVASSAVQASTGKELVVPAADLDTGVVVYDSTGVPVVGVPAPGLESSYDSLRRVEATRFSDASDAVRLIASPFTTTGGSTGVVVVAERLAPYEQAERYALIVSLITGALATAAAAAVAAWVTSRALRPVAVLANTAADWSEHDLTRRFDLGPPTNELTGLAAILDTLLDKVSAAIRSEQRLTSELAHELRTPLTAVQGTADLLLMQQDLTPHTREGLEELSTAARRMSTTIATLLELARTEASMMEAASCSLVDIVAEVVEHLQGDGPMIDLTGLVDQRVAAPHAIAVRAVTPVLANAVRFARTRVAVSSTGGLVGPVRLIVEDDGPGVPDDVDVDDVDIFLPGTTSQGGSGAGLGLALARRMARSVGGDVDVVSTQGPTRFEIVFPRA
jgi:signal transduction histidine kinase